MPPKPTGKKGDAEDFSDAATLPQANIFKFTLVQKSFLSLETREKVRQAVKDKFVATGMNKIISLTRDEIVTYGKSKSYILDAAQMAALPQEDPRKLLSDHDMVARSAADRIFEITVGVRRQKASRPSIQDEEERKLQEEQVDASIFLPDYPQTRAEIFAFSKYSHSLHTVFEIEETEFTTNFGGGDGKNTEYDDEEDTQNRTLPEASVIQGTPDSEELCQAAHQIILAFKSARQDCDVKSPLRNLAVLKVFFRNAETTFAVNEADGSSTERTRSAEDSFVADLYAKNVDKYAQYYFQYLKFKRNVDTVPLVPDQVLKNKLQRLSLDYERDLKTVEALQENSKQLTQGDEEYQQLQHQISQLEMRMSERMSMSKDLNRLSKKSIDDEPSSAEFDRRAYDNDFVKNSETANKISSVLSAMVTHIECKKDENQLSSKQSLNGKSPSIKINSQRSTTDESSLSDIFDRFANEIACDLSLANRGPDLAEAEDPTESISHKHNNNGILIHDETNKTLEVKQTAPLSALESDQYRINQIAEREAQAFANLLVPGRNRHDMPSVPDKSKRLRDAENPQFYPFCTLPVDQAERLLCLSEFQKMIRNYKIDQLQQGFGKHTKYQVFERCFENHMTKEIFAQVLADGLLDDPDIVQTYYSRTDSILLALYNRHFSKIPEWYPNEVVSASKTFQDTINTKIDYERQWKAEYRVMPDFENWIAYFADHIIQENEIPKPVKIEAAPVPVDVVPAGKPVGKVAAPVAEAIDQNALSVTLMRYQLDEELIPKQLFSVEDAKIQNVFEKSAFLYPDDNSVMRVDHYTVGGQYFKKSIVIKDNLKFGLREKTQQPAFVVKSENDYGLVRQVPCGDTEFFLHFENGTKFGVEQIKMERNPQRTIKIPARQMTAQEKTYQAEQKAKLQAATEKATKEKKPVPTDIEIPKDPEPTWEREPLNYFDLLFNDEDISKSFARSTLTFRNGLIVQYLGNGHIQQIQEKSLNQKSDEVFRTVTREGVVIRQMANQDAEMMFPDGVRAQWSKYNLEWIVTNNKGMQRALKDGVFRDLKSIPCAKETDANTGAKMMIREDEVIAVSYKDGSLYCQHRDGTKFHTSADGSEIVIEKFGFASHVIRQTEPRSSGTNDAMGRALDGRVVETFLPDGTKSQTFVDVFQEMDDQIEVYRTLITRQDLSVVICDSEGHVSMISSNTRAALNEEGQKAKLGVKDIDYLEELIREDGQFTPQVYQAHIHREPLKSKIITKNTSDDNLFVLKSDFTLTKLVDIVPPKSEIQIEREKNRQARKLANAMQYATNELNGQKIMDTMIEQTGTYQEPTLKYYNTPRLFVINNDGSAKELLSHLQLEYAMRTKGLQSDKSMMIKMQDVFNHSFVENTFFLTKVVNMAQVQISQQTLSKIDLPDNAKEVMQDKAIEKDYTLMLPKQDQYLFSQIFKMPESDSYQQTAFLNDYERFVNWKMEQVRNDSEFGIIHVPIQKDKNDKDAKVDWEKIEEDNFQNKRISIKILKQRAQPRDQFKSEQFKTQAIKEMHASDTVKAFRQSGQNSPMASLQSSIDKPGFVKKTVKIQGNLERDSQNQPKKKNTVKKNENSQKQKEKVDKKLFDLQQIKVASDFIPEYFQSDSGQDFISKNPQKSPSDEVLTRMKQRLDRMNQSHLQNGDTDFEGDNQQSNIPNEARDNPIVALEPDELKQGSHFTGSKRNDKSQIQGEGSMDKDADPVIFPSLYMQEKIYILQKEQEVLLKSEEHHIVKTKDFNVYGRLREEKPFVKTIQKSNALSDLNEKFITTECITDRRVKISSQAPRFYMNAPSVEEVRKQGQHQMILGAIEKKQTFSELINQANSMVTGVLHDTLKRSIQVMPSAVVFGSIRTGTVNEILISLKNEDSVAHRIMIKPVSDKRVVVKQLEYGIIAPGMIKQISVSIRISEDESNFDRVDDIIQIVTKHDMFKIPVSAQILEANEFDQVNNQTLQETGKPIQNSRVRERLLTKIADSKEESGPVKLTSLPLSGPKN